MSTELANRPSEADEQRALKFTIPLPPVTKKNSQRILFKFAKKSSFYQIIKGIFRPVIPYIAPSEAYEKYEEDCIWFLKPLEIAHPVNIRAIYYMSTKRKVDITNLNSALCDVLVAHCVIVDDDSKIVKSMDGCRVLYDKDNPRTEVVIERYLGLGDDKP